MPSPDPLVAFLYLLMRDHTPTGGVAQTIHKVREMDLPGKYSAPELEQLAERYAHELRAMMGSAEPEPEPEPTGVDRVPPPDGSPIAVPEMADGRTALDSIDAVMSANATRWMKLKQIHSAAGGDAMFAFASVRIAMQRYVKEGRADARGATAARVYRFAAQTSEPDHDDAGEDGTTSDDPAGDTGDRDHEHGEGDREAAATGNAGDRETRGSGDGGRESGSASVATYNPPGTTRTIETAQGSPDSHAGSAETLPPRSPSASHDESPDGVAGGGEEDETSPSPKRRRRKMAEPPHRPLPKPPEMERVQTASHGGRHRRPAPAKVVNVAEVTAAIEPWVREQQTFRRRHVSEAFPHYSDETIRAALLALQNSGIVEVDASAGGGAVYKIPRAPKSPEPSSTIEGRVLGALSTTGASLTGVAIATGMSKEAAAPVLSKLMREGDVRPTTRGGERIYVAA